MSRRPRTPVHFPRMKVRGHRNKAKSAARHQTRTIMRVRVVSTPVESSPGVVETQLVADPNGTHMVSFTTAVRDGWGRRVA